MSVFSLFVLSHNRPDFLRQMLHSIMRQHDRDFELVVSDNSSNDEVEQMMRAEFPQVTYRRRVPMLFNIAHFNRCIDEAEGEYFCLFHDDDLMHPDFVAQMKRALDEHPRVAAVGCNAQIETMGKLERRTSFRALRRLEWIESPRDLARRYFARAQSGFAPFPGYVYRRSAVGDLRLDVNGGKYTDVAWLLNLAKTGALLWLNEPLMTYRIHGGNDGKLDSPRDRLRFMAFLKQNRLSLGPDLVADYRCSFIYKPMLNSPALRGARRELARRFLRHYSWARYANPSLYLALLKRALIKRVVE